VAGKRAVVYVTKMTNESSSFICYGMYQSIIRPKSVYYTTVSAIDWHRSSTYRISEITDADYIFFTPVLNSKPAKASANIAINSLEEEERMIDAFLSALKPGDGLTTLFEHRNFRLSKVSNRSRLQKVFCSFVNSNSWRPVFLEANRDLPSSCSDRDSGR
jgi:hypothetical protein